MLRGTWFTVKLPLTIINKQIREQELGTIINLQYLKSMYVIRWIPMETIVNTQF